MAEYTGDEFDNVITGTEDDDFIDGFGGNDTLVGLGGMDAINGMAGDDMLVGGGSYDWLYGGAGNDTLLGGEGDDYLTGDLGDDTIEGGAGDDYVEIRQGEGVDVIDGGAGDADHIFLGYDDGTLVIERLNAADIKVSSSNPDHVGHRIIRNVELFSMGDYGPFTLAELLGEDDNAAPLAAADATTLTEDGGSITIDVLANDTDADVGDSKTLVSVDSAGATGSVSVVDGQIRYAAAAAQALGAGQTATDTFTYTMKDAAGATSTASVTVTIVGVNDAPVAAADAATVQEDGSVVLSAASLLANDTDVDAADTKTIVSVDAAGALGTVVFDAVMQQVTYVADAAAFDALSVGQTATDTFTYTMRDASGALSTATVTMTIAGDAEWTYGTSGRDVMNGGNGDDFIRAGAGDDRVHGGAGNDALDGQAGDDNVDGGAGNDSLLGGAGSDTLKGGAGLDELNGGAGADMLTGGAGSDVFVFVRGEASGDRVADFGKGEDMLRFEGYGENAWLEQNGREYVIHFDGGMETFTMNTSAIDAGDYLFG